MNPNDLRLADVPAEERRAVAEYMTRFPSSTVEAARRFAPELDGPAQQDAERRLDLAAGGA